MLMLTVVTSKRGAQSMAHDRVLDDEDFSSFAKSREGLMSVFHRACRRTHERLARAL